MPKALSQLVIALFICASDQSTNKAPLLRGFMNSMAHLIAIAVVSSDVQGTLSSGLRLELGWFGFVFSELGINDHHCRPFAIGVLHPAEQVGRFMF